MGWASGSELAEGVWGVVRGFIPKGMPRITAARKIIDLFESQDCDTIDEAERLCRDAGRVYDEEKDRIVYTPRTFPSQSPKSPKSAAELMKDANLPNMLEGRPLNLREPKSQ